MIYSIAIVNQNLHRGWDKMKKIAEIQIGSNTPDYNRKGTPSLFLNYTVAEKFQWSKHHKGVYQAYCDFCGQGFVITHSNSFNIREKIACPACGKLHTHNHIMYSSTSNGILPYKIKMSLIEFASKVELRLKYQGLYLGDDIFHTFQHFPKVYEKYIFDVINNKVTWQRIAGNDKLEYEIGYFNEDFQTLQNKSALCFFQYDHKIKRGDSFTELLRKLREAVNRLAQKKGYQPKSLFISGKRKTRLFTSLLNIAHRVRFWDSENITDSGESTFELNLKENHITKEYLDMSVVDFWQGQGYSYYEALCNTLKLPNIKVIRREFCFKNSYNLVLAFHQGYSTDISMQMYQYFNAIDNELAMTRVYYATSADERKKEAIEIYQALAPKYPDLTFLKMITKYDYYKDSYHLLNNMDKMTKQRYLESKIPLSKLHDWLSVEITAQENREMIFDIPAHIINRLNMQLNHYNLETITKNSQLIRVAQSLKNCSAGYKKRINDKLQLVVISDDNGKIVALLQIMENSIVQAKLYGNKSVSDRMEINDLVIDFAKKTKLDIRTGNIITKKNNVEFARIA